MTEAVPVKETKAQRAERLKRAKNPWEAFDEVRAFAREGRSSVVPEWASTYFKWWGIYTQGDGIGATGGKGGEGLTTDYFMMRIGIPNGIVSASQLRTIGQTHAQIRPKPCRHYRSPEHSTPLAHASNRFLRLSTRSMPSASRPKAHAVTSSETLRVAPSPE